MSDIDISQVPDDSGLDIINAKNLTMLENKTFFENIDENIERLIFDVGLDREVISMFVGTKLSYTEFLDAYTAKYKSGKIKKNSQIINAAYDYLIMFLNTAFIVYGDRIVCVDGEPNGNYVFIELYDRFKPENLPYNHLENFVNYYRSKNQDIQLKRKKGKNE